MKGKVLRKDETDERESINRERGEIYESER